MTAQEKETFYDTQVAPDLLRLGNLCKDNGLSFVAGVEWEPDELGRTAALTQDAGEGIRRADQALRGNFGVGMIAITTTQK